MVITTKQGNMKIANLMENVAAIIFHDLDNESFIDTSKHKNIEFIDSMIVIGPTLSIFELSSTLSHFLFYGTLCM